MKSSVKIITIKSSDITDFAAARNSELAKVSEGWVLFLDSDEVMSAALKAEITQAIKSNQYDAYRIRRQDIFMGRKLQHGENGHFSQIRLAKKSFGTWVRPVHEVWVSHGQTARVGQLEGYIIHAPHNSLATCIAKINRYSSLEAEYRHSRGVRGSMIRIILNPVGKFLYNYLGRSGWRDGIPGFIMAACMSFHSFLTWSKLYILWRKK